MREKENERVSTLQSIGMYCLEQGELLLRIILASILGMAIGFERKNRSKMAGVRTHAIVAFGAALMMIVSKYGFGDIPDYDASRVAAQIVSGVGFLGAGIIFVKNNTSVSGLTTAAGIWATAGVGMSVGAGQYVVGIASGILLVGLQGLLHRVGFLSNEAYRVTIKLTIDSKVSIHELENHIAEEQIEIVSIRINRSDNEDVKVEMELVFPPQIDKVEFVNTLADYPGVISVRG